jgi:hypothetical protein
MGNLSGLYAFKGTKIQTGLTNRFGIDVLHVAGEVRE